MADVLQFISKSGTTVTVTVDQPWEGGMAHIRVSDSEGQGPVEGILHRYPEGDCVLEGRWARKKGFRFSLSQEQVDAINAEFARIEAKRVPLTFVKSLPPKPQPHPDIEAHFWASRDDSFGW